MPDFHLYILKCADDSYYIGHTDNLEKRIAEHKLGVTPCYTSTRLPIELAYNQPFASRGEALTAEHKIKKWSRKKKEAFIKGEWGEVARLAKKDFKK